MAYLRRSGSTNVHPGSSGYLFAPNAVYYHGTEQTARGAFGYRLGMTMAEWACHGLMGLGQRFTPKASPPADAGPAWSSVRAAFRIWSGTTGVHRLLGWLRRKGRDVPGFASWLKGFCN